MAWEYEVEGGQPRGSVWLSSSAPETGAIGDPNWIKVFASKDSAEKWVKNNDSNREIWEYLVQE
ncbi:hypothetical protein HZZ16_27220 [Bradyrhizobium sp. CNPSo 4016]|nr:hypothetical protein [Bradyrhizobium glycinis]